MLAEMRDEKDARRYLVAGWHELAIDRCLSKQATVLEVPTRQFIVEGRVLRSTAPGFAGKRWGHVCALKWRTAIAVMEQLAHASGDPAIGRLANDAKQCAHFGIRKPDQILDIDPPTVVLADICEISVRHGIVFGATFVEACR